MGRFFKGKEKKADLPEGMILYKATSKKYIERNLLTNEEAERHKNTVFPRKIKFSILVPLYNTPIRYLVEMLESVLAQTYENWELCLADGSDEKHNYVEKTCLGYSKKDSRIVYKKLIENKGISENTNECINMATGDFLALFDHDDLLHPAALFEMMNVICKEDADFVYTDEAVFENDDIFDVLSLHFKPDFAPDTLLTNNYICHFTAFDARLLDVAGRFRNYDGSQDHDLILRLTDAAKKICHIPRVLYYWRSHPASVASDISAKPYAVIAGRKVVKDYLASKGIAAEVESTKVFPVIYKIRYEIEERALVSILIPNKDHVTDLARCIESIREKTTYENYEIIVIENNSTQELLFRYYEYLNSLDNIRVIRYADKFNYAAINNYAVKYAKGDYLLLLNNDTEVITPEWIEELLMHAQRDTIGAVGAKLYYGNDTIQHSGLLIGIGPDRTAGHVHYGMPRTAGGYQGKLHYVQNLCAVTGACLMVKKTLYDEVDGLDENFSVAYNDVDFCLRLREKGYLNIFAPDAELYHYESKSRGLEITEAKRRRLDYEANLFRERWKTLIEKGDPYYNDNLSLNCVDYTVRSENE